MDIINDYPITKKEFIDYMLFTYSVDEYSFDTAPWEDQCIAIARFLGYQTEFPGEWSADKIEDVIRDYLYKYEDLKITFPFGVVDLFKDISIMDCEQRKEIFPEMYKQAVIHNGLNSALVYKVKDYTMKAEEKVLLSLNSALRTLLNVIEPEVDEEKLWEELLTPQQYYENPPF